MSVIGSVVESETVVTAPTKRRHHRPESRIAWLFVLPFLLLFATFIAVPALIAIMASFTNMGVGDLRSPFGADFVGLDTYIGMFQDPTFLQAVGTTALYVVLCVPFSMGFGLALAILLNSGIRRLRALYRAAVYIPVITNVVAIAVIWQYAFSSTGPVNSSLQSIGLPAVDWMGDPGHAIFTVVLMSVWRNIGMCMVLFLAGLQVIPQDVYEAARTDGAGIVRQFWSITLPLLRPTTLLVTFLMTLFFINIFEEPYVLTAGGPLGSTRSMALWVYQQFGFGNTAVSMAGSIVLLVLVALVAAVQFRVLRPKH